MNERVGETVETCPLGGILNALAGDIYTLAKEKGFHSSIEPNIGNFMANLHSEVSEAWEEWRAHRMETTLREDGKPEGFPSEMADVIIRALDTCHTLGIDIEAEILRKLVYNRTREHRHGGKRA